MRKNFKAIFDACATSTTLSVAICCTGCAVSSDLSNANTCAQAGPPASIDRQKADHELVAAEERLAAAIIRADQYKFKVIQYLGTIPGYESNPRNSEAVVRIRLLTKSAAELQESLNEIQAKRKELSSRITNDAEWDKHKEADLENYTKAEGLISTHINEIDAELREWIEVKQYFAKIKEEFESNVMQLKAAEQERDTAMAELQALREANSKANDQR